MKTLKYGYFGEDNALQIFLENYLHQLPSYLNRRNEIAFENDESFKLKGKDKPNVRKLFAEAAQKGLAYHQQDMFFVGVDSDDDDHGKLYSEMVEKLFPDFKDQTFVFIPVKAIEHWLIYIKFKREHPSSNKNEPYEQIARSDAKKRIYGDPLPRGETKDKITKDLTQHMDINWLENRSASFRHFHLQVTDFLRKM